MWLLRVLFPLLLIPASSFEVQIQPVAHPYRRFREAFKYLSAFQTPPELLLENFQNVRATQLQYRGTLFFGSPPQGFELIFDTGSSWTWVNDVSCGPLCHSAKSFNRSESTTFEKNGTMVSLRYGTGAGEAEMATETLALFSDGSGQVTKQTILLMKRNSGFTGMQADGILVRGR